MSQRDLNSLTADEALFLHNILFSAVFTMKGVEYNTALLLLARVEQIRLAAGDFADAGNGRLRG
jgi:hypothetical protein